MSKRHGYRPRRASARRGSGTSTLARNNPYGLSRSELRAEIRRLSALGWMTWELRYRFDRTSKEPAE